VFKTWKAFIDHRIGNFFTKGLVQTNDLNVDHDDIIDNTLTTEYLNVNQSANINALIVTGDDYMASGYMSQGVNATNALFTNGTITNVTLNHVTILDHVRPAPSHVEAYVNGMNGAELLPIFCTI
jgi:hypothetical protein